MGAVKYYTDPATKIFNQKTNFMGGINQATHDDLLPEKCEKNLVNFDISYAGALLKRKGFIRHTNLHNLIKMNHQANFTNYPTLTSEKTQTYFRESDIVQGVFQWLDTVTRKEYAIMLYCNQVFIKLLSVSDIAGELQEYETWTPVTMQKYDEENSAYAPMLTGTLYEQVYFKENEAQTAVAVEVPLFSNVYDKNGVRRTIVGADAWYEFLEKDYAKTYKIDGAAHGGSFYLATGYKLFVINNEEGVVTAKQLAPTIPTTPEYNLYGGNTLSENPDTAIKSHLGISLQVRGLIMTSEYEGSKLQGGIVSNPIHIRGITIRPDTTYKVYYRFSYQQQSATELTEWVRKTNTNNGWEALTLADNVEPTWDLSLSGSGWYNVMLEVVPVAAMNTQTWEVSDRSQLEAYTDTSLQIFDTPVFKTDINFSVHTCRRLLVYYNQLLVYKDTLDGNVLYISDLNRFTYFPSGYTLIVDTPTRDAITSINYYQNVLVIFTSNNIFMLKGTAPSTFDLKNINRTIGCKYGWTARAVGNYLYFMSSEGLFKLKSLYNTEDRLNVEQEDFPINPLFRKDADYTAFTFKGNYYLVELAPYKYDATGVKSSEIGKIFIYDTFLEAWTSYAGEYLNFNNILIVDNNVFATDRNTNSFLVYPNLKVLDQDIVTYTDGETYYLNADNTALEKVSDGIDYKVTLEEAYNSFGKPYHTKKFKEIMLKAVDSKQGKTTLGVTALVDGMTAFEPTKYEVKVDDLTGSVYVVVTEEGLTLPSVSVLGESFILNESLLGDYDISLHKIRFSAKGKTIKYIIEQTDDKFFGLLGHSTVYKEKKPSVK
jgi:hypothetical protein